MILCGLPHEWWARLRIAYWLSKERPMARRKFTVEFKRSAVKLVQQQGYTVTEAARSLGVDPGAGSVELFDAVCPDDWWAAKHYDGAVGYVNFASFTGLIDDLFRCILRP